MTAAEICWLILAVIGLAYALASTWGTALVVRGVPVLLRDRSPPPGRWPRVSLIVPARNEVETLGPAMRSRLAEGYPALEVVLVDDRSTDGTGALVDAIAAEDSRVRALHLDSLPPGWLGKLHAMSEGLRRATGEWILFSDADVHLAPGTIARAVSLAEAQRLDHLSLLPQLDPATWLVDAALASFTRTGLVLGRVWLVSDPRSKVGGSVGAFGLVRRDALERSPGIEHLRLEVADDLALGQMLKSSGSRSALANGRELVRIHWYRSLAELTRGTEKGAAVFDHRLLPALCWTGALGALELGPFLAAARTLCHRSLDGPRRRGAAPREHAVDVPLRRSAHASGAPVAARRGGQRGAAAPRGGGREDPWRRAVAVDALQPAGAPAGSTCPGAVELKPPGAVTTRAARPRRGA